MPRNKQGGIGFELLRLATERFTRLMKGGLKNGQTLLGLYQGAPLTKWGGHYRMCRQIKSIFQEPIEARYEYKTKLSRDNSQRYNKLSVDGNISPKCAASSSKAGYSRARNTQPCLET